MRQPKPAPDIATLFQGRHLDVTQAVGDPNYSALILAAQNAYHPWERVRFKALAEGLDPELVWLLIKSERMRSAKALPLTDHTGRPLTFWLPPAAQQELMLVDQQLAGRIAQHTRDVIRRSQTDFYIVNSLMEEAIASSMLEGAATTRREAKQMLREQRTPRTPGEKMVANNYQAINFIREHLSTPLTPEFILDLHTILTRDTMPAEQIGRWRTPEDDIKVIDHRDNEIMHEPPEAESLPGRLKVLTRFANELIREGKNFIHPVVRAIALHFQFGFEHPFCDGNGRVARALFYWHMLRNRYWLFEFLPLSQFFRKSPAKYARAFVYTETDDFDLGYFLTYHLRVIGMARHGLTAYLEREQQERERVRVAFGQDQRLNSRQKLLLQRLRRMEDASVTIAGHQHTTDLAYATARSDLIKLEEFGYLASSKVGKKLVFKPVDSSG